MTNVKPIETRYSGHRFRSRLEARWAVFFDTANILWHYEHEGYPVGGRPYLPDFYLPECGTWIEVKGHDSMLDVTLMEAAATQLPLLSYKGEPGPRLMILGPIDRVPSEGDLGWIGIAEDWSRPGTLRHDRFGFGSFDKNRRPWYLDNGQVDERWTVPTVDTWERGVPGAYLAAKSARFEHGESGPG
ncbi:hypothetical protein GCM10009827_115650 [Dactylosporangium maewongense]|uniref:Uncharacterized protein n=1 Tax=Dactylosporangium maewongense TaxID=634393 RepID=A0ABN2DCA9_9ACTN